MKKLVLVLIALLALVAFNALGAPDVTGTISPQETVSINANVVAKTITWANYTVTLNYKAVVQFSRVEGTNTSTRVYLNNKPLAWDTKYVFNATQYTISFYLNASKATTAQTIYIIWFLMWNQTFTFDGVNLKTTLGSPFSIGERLGTGVTVSKQDQITIEVHNVASATGSPYTVTYRTTEVTYSGTSTPLPQTSVNVMVSPIVQTTPIVSTWTISYPDGTVANDTWAGRGDVLSGVTFSPKLPKDVSTVIYLNKTVVGSFTPQPGMYNLTMLATQTKYTQGRGVVYVNKTQTTFNAHQLNVMFKNTPPGVTVGTSGAPLHVNIEYKINGVGMKLYGLFDVHWNTTVKLKLNGSSVLGAKWLNVTISPQYTNQSVLGTPVSVLFINGAGSASASTPNIISVSPGSGVVGVIVHAGRDVIRVLDPANVDVQLATRNGYAIFPVKAVGAYTVKLATKLSVTNVYVHDGKQEGITATVKVLRDGNVVATAKGEKVEFTLEPGVTYTVQGDNGNEVVSSTVGLLQDTSIQLSYSTPSAVTIPYELVNTIALVILVILAVYLVYKLTRRGISIEIG